MGPKKAKKTKAQIEEERLAKEEEDRKAHELELKRQAEEAERQRIEELRIQAERKAFREAELIRLQEEHAIYVDKEEGRQLQMIAEVAAEEATTAWLKYKDPVDEPDAGNERDMNTFITLTSDASTKSLPEALDLISKIKRVSMTVEDTLSDSITSKNAVGLGRCQSYLSKFYDIIVDKMDAVTAQLLRFADDQLNDKSEINVEDSNDGISIGIWCSFNEMRPIRKSVQFEKINFSIDIPKQILQHDARFVFRVLRIAVDKFSATAYASTDIGQSNKYVLGDIFALDFLFPPPQPHTIRAKRWTLRDKSTISLNLRRSVYPSSVACRCMIKVPDDIIMSDDVRIAVWSDELNAWTEDGISDYQYSESNRMVHFYTTVVGNIALVRDRSSDLPYKKWSLSSLHVPIKGAAPTSVSGGSTSQYERQARLLLQTQRHEVVIDITGTKCKLVKPNIKQVADLIGVEMSPGRLLYKLQRKGINIMPTEADCAKVDSIKLKDLLLEEQVLLNLARCSSACDFQSTPWNQQLSPDEVGLLARESTAYTGGVESYDFECILAEKDEVSIAHKHSPDVGRAPGAGIKFTLVIGNEYGLRRNFAHVPRSGEQPHLELGLALQQRVTGEASARIERSAERFVQTVYMLLQLARPLSLN